MATRCNLCGKGYFEFVGHLFRNRTAKIYSILCCNVCGAIHEHEQRVVGPGAFDVDHPQAINRMLPTEDWVERELKRRGLYEKPVQN